MRKLCSLGVFLFLLTFSGVAKAQVDNASLTVTAVDEAGARVGGVKISVLGANNGLLREGATNADGIFNLPFLTPGTYSIKAEKTGFNQAEVKNIVLHVQDQANIEVKLKIGSVSETVTVSGGALQLNTQDASVGTVVDHQFVENLPLNGRSFQSLISLTPGVVISQVNSGAPGQFNINGQRADSNYFTVDGVSANFGVSNTGDQSSQGGGNGVQTAATGGYNNIVSVDAMQEFKVTTATFAPEYGQFPGGQISIVTRSGTNHFHGDAYDYLRNTVLDANNWFNNYHSLGRSPERQNDFGGVFGGPIWKDKLFFFGSVEYLRLQTPQTASNVPVPSFCARGTAPPTGPTSCATFGVTPGQPIGIPAVAAMQPYLQAYPNPTAPFVPLACSPGGCTAAQLLSQAQAPELGLFSAAFSNKTNIDAWALKLDWNPTSNMNFFVRGNDSPTSTVNVQALPSITEPAVSNIKTFTVGQSYIFRPNLVNDIRYNYTFINSFATFNPTTFGGAVVPPNSALFPAPFTANNTFFFLIPAGVGFLEAGGFAKNFGKQYNLVDTLSWTRGTHQLKFGVNYRRLTDLVNREGFESQPLFNVVSATMANPSGYSWISGSTPNSYGADNFPAKDFWYTNFGVYVQDTWKATSRLTVTYGLRWDVDPPPNAPSGAPEFQALNNVDANYLTNTVVLPNGTPIYHTEWSAFAPRLAVAYQQSTDPRWGRVIRAGFGVFYDSGGEAAGFSEATFQAASYSAATTPAAPTLPLLNATQYIPTIPTAAPFGFVTTVNPHLRMPYTTQWSLAVQQQLGSNQTFTVTYSGNVAKDLLRRDEYIECLPASFTGGSAACNQTTNGQFKASFYAIGNESYSNYNALEALYQRSLSHGLLALVSYTWSHCLDTGSYQSGTNAINTFSQNIHDYYGNCDFDIRQSFQSAFSYSIPSFSHNTLVDEIAGHWGLDGTFRARTAPPVDLVDSTAYFAQGNPFLPGGTVTNPAGIKAPIRPLINPGVPDYVYGANCMTAYKLTTACPGGWGLNPAAFQNLTSNTLVSSTAGMLGRNQLRGFGWNQIDATLRREFPIHESLKLQFRADFFNLLNHPAFFFNSSSTNPLDVTNGQFGRATSTLNNFAQAGFGYNFLYQIGGPRSIQLSLKLVF